MQKEGIHTAIETSLYADQEVIKEILPYLDRIFADFKLSNRERSYALHWGFKSKDQG